MSLKLGVNLRTVPVTSNYSITVYDDVILVSSSGGAVQLQFPDATLVPGKVISVCKVTSDSNLVTLIPTGTQVIDGLTQFAFSLNKTYQFASISGAWLSIGAGIPAIQSTFSPNAVINGNFDFMQRGTSITVSASQLNYGLDRFFGYSRLGGSPGVLTLSQNSDVPTVAQSGFQSKFSMNIACSTADNTMASGSVYMTGHKIEGFNAAPMLGKIGYLTFWVKSNITGGPFSVTFQNGAGNRSWYSTFSINSANTWEKKTILVDFTSESGGATWAIDNTAGINIGVVLAANHTNVSTLNQWTNSTAYHVTGQSTSFMSSTSNFMRFSQFMFSEAQGAAFTRTGRSISDELVLCQRYFEKSYDQGINPGAVDANCQRMVCSSATPTQCSGLYWKVTKRATPTTFTIYHPNSGATGSAYRVSDAATIGVTVSFLSQSGFRYLNTPTNDEYDIHWTAESEL